jgi:hypothetical protein
VGEGNPAIKRCDLGNESVTMCTFLLHFIFILEFVFQVLYLLHQGRGKGLRAGISFFHAASNLRVAAAFNTAHCLVRRLVSCTEGVANQAKRPGQLDYFLARGKTRATAAASAAPIFIRRFVQLLYLQD